MSVNLPAVGPARSLDRPGLDPSSRLTERDVQEPSTLVRILTDLLRDVAGLVRRWSPRRIDFEGRALLDDGTTKLRLEHRFGGAVRYWIVDWSGDDPPNLRRDAASDLNTLVLTSTSAGTATIRVEEAG